jgi:multicomponent Na+:H+ antiporter subunit A
MIALIVIGAVVAAFCAVLGGRLGRRVFLVGMLAPGAAVAWLVASGTRPGDVVTESTAWVPELGLSLDFRLDGLGMLMSILIGAIGVLVFVYAWRYFGEREGLGRFAAYLVFFETAMLGLVLADNLLLLFVFWELTSIMSYLLIGFDDESVTARTGALQALLVTGLGGLTLLAGIVLLAQEGGTFSSGHSPSLPSFRSTSGCRVR